MAKCVNATQWWWLFVACEGRSCKEAQIKCLGSFSWVLPACSVQHLYELRQEDRVGAPHYWGRSRIGNTNSSCIVFLSFIIIFIIIISQKFRVSGTLEARRSTSLLTGMSFLPSYLSSSQKHLPQNHLQKVSNINNVHLQSWLCPGSIQEFKNSWRKVNRDQVTFTTLFCLHHPLAHSSSSQPLPLQRPHTTFATIHLKLFVCVQLRLG